MRAIVLSFLLGWLAAGGLGAMDLSGTYDNEGVILSFEGAREGERISFQALLALEFDPARSAILYAGTARFEIDQEKESFLVTCWDQEEGVAWRGAWKRGAGYDFNAKGVKLLLRRNGEGGDLFLFRLGNDGKPNLLVVTIERVESGRFGPTRKPVGTFYFVRSGLPATGGEVKQGAG